MSGLNSWPYPIGKGLHVFFWGSLIHTHTHIYIYTYIYMVAEAQLYNNTCWTRGVLSNAASRTLKANIRTIQHLKRCILNEMNIINPTG